MYKYWYKNKIQNYSLNKSTKITTMNIIILKYITQCKENISIFQIKKLVGRMLVFYITANCMNGSLSQKEVHSRICSLL